MYIKVDCSSKVKFLAKPSLISSLNFYENEEAPLVFKRDFVIDKKGLFHGWTGYLKAGLSKNVILSTSPEEPKTHWEQVFFPISEVVKVKEKDRVHCKIKPIYYKDYIYWQWDTSIYRDKKEIFSFSQNNFNLNKEELALNRKDFSPVLSREGKIYQEVLSLCNGKKTMEEIAKIMQSSYHNKYKNIKSAFQDVGDIIRKKVE